MGGGVGGGYGPKTCTSLHPPLPRMGESRLYYTMRLCTVAKLGGGDRFTLSPASCHPFLRELTIAVIVIFCHLFSQCWSTQPIYRGFCTIDPNFPTFTAAVVFAFLPMHTMPSSKAEEDACMHFRARCTDATLMASGGSYFNGIFCTPCQYFSKHFYGILH